MVKENIKLAAAAAILIFQVGCIDRHHSDNEDEDFKFPEAPVIETKLVQLAGRVQGLLGNGLVLKAGGEKVGIQENGPFEFRETHDSEEIPELKVFQQPNAPTQICTAADSPARATQQSVSCTCPAGGYTFSGRVEGLTHSSLTLQNGDDTFILAQPGNYILAKEYANCSEFDLRIISQPAGLACSLSIPQSDRDLGRFDGSNITANIVCVDASIRYSLSARVSGVDAGASGSMTISHDTGSLNIDEDGIYALNTDLANGAGFNVTISHSYSSLDCQVSGGSGTIDQGDRVVRIDCAPLRCRQYASESSWAYSTGESYDEVCVLGPQQSQMVLACEKTDGGSVIGRSARYYDNLPAFIEEAVMGDYKPGYIRARYLEDYGPDDSTNQDGDQFTSAFYNTDGTLNRIVGRSVIDVGNWRDATLTVRMSNYDSFGRPTVGSATADISTVGGCKDVNININYNDSTLTETYNPTGGVGYGQAAQEEPCPITRNGLYKQETYDAFGNVTHGDYYDPEEATQIPWNKDRIITETKEECYADVEPAEVRKLNISVDGLTGTLVVQNQGRNDFYIFNDGNFSLPSELFDGDAYDVTVLSQPFLQSCLVSAGQGTISGSDAQVQITCIDASDGGYTVSAQVNGLNTEEPAGLVLTNNGLNPITVPSDGTYPFPLFISDGGSYDVAVSNQPVNYLCSVSDGSGTIDGQSAVVSVTCAYSGPALYTVGGEINGYNGSLTLVLNGTQEVNVNVNGSATFSFPEQLTTGTAYQITVADMPVGQDCVLVNATGTAGSAGSFTMTCSETAEQAAARLQEVTVDVLKAPAGLTVDYVWDHAGRVAASQSLADGSDVALYFAAPSARSLKLNGQSGLQTVVQALPQNFTFETWFRSGSGAGGVIAGFTGEDGGAVRLYIGKTGRVFAGMRPDDSTPPITISSFPGYNDNSWHHVAAGWHPDGGLRLFIDGVKVASDGTLTPADLPSGPGRFEVGRGDQSDWPEPGDAAEGRWIGQLDELRISNSARYAESYAAQVAPHTPDSFTVAMYHFDEGAGPVLDFSGRSNGLQVDSGGAGSGGSPEAALIDWVDDGPLVNIARRIAVAPVEGSGFNAGDTTLAFKLQAASGPGLTGGRYFLYYGTSSAAQPLDYANNIYAFADGSNFPTAPAWALNPDSAAVYRDGSGLHITVSAADSAVSLQAGLGDFIPGSRFSGGMDIDFRAVLAALPADTETALVAAQGGDELRIGFQPPSDWFWAGDAGSGSSAASPGAVTFFISSDLQSGGAGQSAFSAGVVPDGGSQSTLVSGNLAVGAVRPSIDLDYSGGSMETVDLSSVTIRLQNAEDEDPVVAGGPAGPKDEYNALQSDLAAMDWESIRATNANDYDVTENLNLYTTAPAGSTVSWSSDKPEFVNPDGTVVRPTAAQGAQTVIVTATITNGPFSETVTFTLLIPPRADVIVSGSVTGLTGEDLTLQLESSSGAAPVTQSTGLSAPDSEFIFDTPIHENDSFDVTVTGQPSLPTQTCVVSGGNGTAGTEPISVDVTCSCPAGNFKLGGSLSGLVSGSVLLQDHNGQQLPVAANGDFEFAGTYPNCSAYGITLVSAPADVACSIVQPGGYFDSADARLTQVQCEPVSVTYTVAASIYGLEGGSVTLRNTSAGADINETVAVSGDGYYVFPGELYNGADYEVSIEGAPAGLSCTVSPQSGNIKKKNALVRIDCGAQVCRDYAVSSEVSSQLSGGGWDTECVLEEESGLWKYACQKLDSSNNLIADVNTYYSSMDDFVAEYPQAAPTIPPITWEFSEELPVDSDTTGEIKQDAVYSNGRLSRLVINTMINANGWTPVTMTANVTGYDGQNRPLNGTATADAGSLGGCRDINISFNYNEGSRTVTRSASGGTCYGTACLADACPYTRNAIYEQLVFDPNGIVVTRRVKDATGTNESNTYADNTSSVVTDQACYTPATQREEYPVNVTVAGLASSVVLTNRGEEELSVSGTGSFAFAGRLPAGEPYDVAVKNQPFGQNCTVTGASGTMAAPGVTVQVDCENVSTGPGVYAFHVDVTGLAGTIELSNDYGQIYNVSQNGRFTLPEPFANGDTYRLILHTVPGNLDCSITNGQGTFGDADVVSQVDCVDTGPPRYYVGGTVSGLSGSLILKKNDSEELTVSNGNFQFAGKQLTGTSYAVVIEQYLTDQECSISGGSGTIASADIDSINVVCEESPISSSSHMKELIVSASDPVPAGYSVAVDLDHAALTAGGDAQADGDDVRIFWQPDDGRSLELNGSSTWAHSSRRFDNPNTFTIELWFRTSSGDGGYLAGFADGLETDSDEYDRMLYLSDNGRVFFGVYDNGFDTVSSNPGYNDGLWHHAAATLDPAGGMRLFVDGQLVDSDSSVRKAQNYSGYWRMGRERFDSFFFFFRWPSDPSSDVLDGRIDEVRVSDVVRYQDNFNPRLKEFIPDENTVWLLHLDEASGSSIVDYSGQANHAVLKGGAGTWVADSPLVAPLRELDRIADPVYDWNRSDTKVWFKLQRPLGGGQSVLPGEYIMYYGNPDAVSPPELGNNVFAVYDSFEDGQVASFWNSRNANGRITEQSGALRLRIDYTANGGWPSGSPRLTTPAPYYQSNGETGFVIETKVLDYSSNYQSLAGIGAFGPSNDLATITVYNDSIQGLALMDSIYPRTLRSELTDGIHLRMRRDNGANEYLFDYSLSGVDYTSLGDIGISWQPDVIGLYAANWDSRPLVDVSFEYFQARLKVDSEPVIGEGASGLLADYQKLLEDMSATDFASMAGANSYPTAVVANLSPPAAGPVHGSTIVWSSSDPSLLTAGGSVNRSAVVARPAQGVTLTASFTYNGFSREKTFSIHVLADPLAWVSAGDSHSCAVLSGGELYCFGSGDDGRLGFGNMSNLGSYSVPGSAGQVPLDTAAIQVSAGYDFTCALLMDGSVWCFGDNDYGQLGIGSTEDIGDDEIAAYGSPVGLAGGAVQVSAGRDHACAVLENGNVSCWGRGASGRLGYGNTNNIGDDPEEASIPVIDFGQPVRQVAAGDAHTCALLDDGNVTCWGEGSNGRLGNGSTTDIGDNEYAGGAPVIDFTQPVSQISAGGAHTCALLIDSVVCWGEGSYGRLGYGNQSDISTATAAGTVDVGLPVTGVDAGAEHTCVTTTTGRTQCWGRGTNGRLGYGMQQNIGDNENPSVFGAVDYPQDVILSAAGGRHSCALNGHDELYCWGDNGSGQLGQGDTITIGDDEQTTVISAVNLTDDGSGPQYIAGYVQDADGGLTLSIDTGSGPVTEVLGGDGRFELSSATITGGGAYTITVDTPPSGQVCSVINGTGVAGPGPVTNIFITCSEDTGGGGGGGDGYDNGDWGYRYQMVMNNSGGSDSLNNFPVLIVLNGQIDWGKMKANGGDIRFADAAGNPLDFEFEKWEYGVEALIWVKVPSIGAFSSADYIWMYYDNPTAITNENPSGVWSNGYIAVYHLNDNDNTIWSDSTANGHHGTSGASFAPEDAFVGDGIRVDNGGVDVSSVLASASTSAGTLEAWYKASNASIVQLLSSMDIVGFQNTKFQYQCILAAVGICLTGWQNIYTIGSDFQYKSTNQNTWHNLAQTWSGSNLQYYYDGSSAGSDSGSASFGSYAFIGSADGLGLLTGFNGQVDEVRFSSVARSAGWLKASYESSRDNFVNYAGEQSSAVFAP